MASWRLCVFVWGDLRLNTNLGKASTTRRYPPNPQNNKTLSSKNPPPTLHSENLRDGNHHHHRHHHHHHHHALQHTSRGNQCAVSKIPIHSQPFKSDEHWDNEMVRSNPPVCVCVCISPGQIHLHIYIYYPYTTNKGHCSSPKICHYIISENQSDDA